LVDEIIARRPSNLTAPSKQKIETSMSQVKTPRELLVMARGPSINSELPHHLLAVVLFQGMFII